MYESHYQLPPSQFVREKLVICRAICYSIQVRVLNKNPRSLLLRLSDKLKEEPLSPKGGEIHAQI